MRRRAAGDPRSFGCRLSKTAGDHNGLSSPRGRGLPEGEPFGRSVRVDAHSDAHPSPGVQLLLAPLLAASRSKQKKAMRIGRCQTVLGSLHGAADGSTAIRHSTSAYVLFIME